MDLGLVGIGNMSYQFGGIGGKNYETDGMGAIPGSEKKPVTREYHRNLEVSPQHRLLAIADIYPELNDIILELMETNGTYSQTLG